MTCVEGVYMKTLFLIFHIIKNYVIKNKNIFIVFISSYILMGLVIVFLYGAFFPYVTNRRSEKLTECRYIVNFTSEIPISYLNTFFQNEHIKNNRHFEVETRIPGNEYDWMIHAVFSSEHNVILKAKQSGRTYFTEEEIENSDPVAIVTPDLGQLGEVIEIEPIGKLTIIGVLDTIIPHTVYIPDSLFLDQQFTLNTMYFVVQKRLNFQEIRDLENFLYVDETVAIVQGPAPTTNVVLKDFSEWMIPFFIILLVIFILFIFFIQYMSEKNKRMYALFGILGENKLNILFYLIIERGILALASMCIACGIHFLLRDFIHKIFVLPFCKMIFTDYLFLIALSFLASLILAVVYAVTYLFKKYTIMLKQSE